MMDAFTRNIGDLVESIERCQEERHILPCLALLYTGIDVISSLEREPGEGVRKSFTRWVSRYMLEAGALECTALELYSARCAVVHTFTAHSDLTRAGKARKIVYAWGTGEAGSLQKAAGRLGYNDVAVHLTDLVATFRTGVADYLEDARADSKRWAKVTTKAGMWFATIGTDVIRQFLENTSEPKNS